MKQAVEFMMKADEALRKLSSASAYADWNWKVNLTDHNREIKDNTSDEATEYLKKIYDVARNYSWQSYREKNYTLFRWFELVAKGLTQGAPGLYSSKQKIADPYSKMSEIFGKAKVCPPEGSTGKCVSDVEKVFETTRDPKILKHFWLEFRKQTGEKYKDLFLEAIKEENTDANDFGYKNMAQLNTARYEDKDFLKNMAEEMKKIQPFYKQIHAYVRKKLKMHYKRENIKSDGPIPAHLLGDMYAQQWSNIFNIVKPYPGYSGRPNVTKAMHKKKLAPIDMFIIAEKFFTSIGLKAMTPRFWHFSMIEKPVGKDADCHGASYDFYEKEDYRIGVCSQVNAFDLDVIHHEMGHIEYFMHYSHLPFLFRDSANPGFHEAIGDAILLSSMTPTYLTKIGLLKRNNVRKRYESTINYLMQTALNYAVTLPYDYIIDYWRNKVYERIIKDTELNKKYWLYRYQFQGVCPPTRRTEKNFDIGAKWHIAGGVEYFRYYVANIFQFQIHKILCEKANHTGPLHECNIYKNKKAGQAFAKFLSQGKSKHWKILLRSFSDGKFTKLDASAMLEYFEPLMKWLKKKNAREYIGWKSDDPMSCPGDEEGSKGGSDTTDPTTKGSITTNFPRGTSSTSVPPTVVSSTSVPPTVASSTSVPPTVASSTGVPPTVASSTSVPPTVASSKPLPQVSHPLWPFPQVSHPLWPLPQVSHPLWPLPQVSHPPVPPLPQVSLHVASSPGVPPLWAPSPKVSPPTCLFHKCPTHFWPLPQVPPPTVASSTNVPPTVASSTSAPPTVDSSTSVPPTVASSTSVPPTVDSSTSVPNTVASSTSVQPTENPSPNSFKV
ncbi:Angiotensin-converting enzyme like protein [Argiope bruennichi]|uniref:Angiotensin-converting enzyme n=1 Tax=Argiope bruennichi TaxID=94029 RepID=A0A8T0FZP3_ARGBR|nr:Angiotensin-converting enzyme like protein [Argiope bruennichi]